MTINERNYLNTVQVGERLAVLGDKGLRAFGCGYQFLKAAGFVRVEVNRSGSLELTRIK